MRLCKPSAAGRGSLSNGMMAFILLAAGLLIACDGGTPQSAEEIVGQRAKQRWDVLIKGDTEAAYGFLSPGSRSMTPLDVYERRLRNRIAKWESANVKSVQCEEDRCKVGIEVTYLYMGGNSAFRGQTDQSGFVETWIQSDGGWWYVPQRKGLGGTN